LKKDVFGLLYKHMSTGSSENTVFLGV